MNAKLCELADVKAGYTIRKRPPRAEVEPYPMIQIRNLSDDGVIAAGELATIELPPLDERYFVKPGDLLFAARGTRNVAAVCRDLPARTVAGGQFFVITPKRDAVLADYLAWFVNSREGQTALRELHRGSFVQLISAPDLRELPVPVPPLERQRAIVELDRLAHTEHRLARELADLRLLVARERCARLCRPETATP